jgi:DNA-binding response OmpR family regulator
MNSQAILIVEDEPKTAASIRQGLEENGYQVHWEASAEHALVALKQQSFALVVLDIILPEKSGLDFLIEFRKTFKDTPVLFLSALGASADRINGFSLGGDDYLVKPFEFAELLWRVRSLLKRSQADPNPPRQLVFGDLRLDLSQCLAFREDERIELTARELALLEYFMLHPNEVISKKEIAEKVWNIHFDSGTNYIEVYVNYLRNKIDKRFQQKYIQTVHGLGYTLREPK